MIQFPWSGQEAGVVSPECGIEGGRPVAGSDFRTRRMRSEQGGEHVGEIFSLRSRDNLVPPIYDPTLRLLVLLANANHCC